ncbi:uracil-DNA glycosylase [Saccharothrix tamanrassetensis]|uniref:Uracil-DNA glycosylase n=1 Tax=Saccharothrix tamanrassetensis TaxID=1051531 RepID=A0A841CPA0_9PSEU|nr:uracil-DNA glycosylase [Saccharothrix tamanrassetensis]MBB5959481.1 uracil-DNA glycosylase [Saccharothrix tamanrassetensis]
MPSNVFPASPKGHRDPRIVARKMTLLQAPHMKPLTEFARRIADERKVDVPLFDPASGGVNAKVLLLLESPGPASAASRAGSGLISLDNDDQTAVNGFTALKEAGLSRQVCLNWNIVPWYLKGHAPTPAELRAAVPYLVELLGILKSLKVVVVLGTPAGTGWSLSGRGYGLKVFNGPHPSPQSINRDRATRWPQLVEAFRQAAAAIA